jgi:hypothetical protein
VRRHPANHGPPLQEGNKRLVDQIKAEREEFAKKLELPQQAPAALTAQPKVARARLESAYEVAVKDYTKAKNDERADSVEKELAEF